MKLLICLLICCVIQAPVWAAKGSSTTKLPKLNLLQLEEQTTEHSYSVIENRIARWLDRLPFNARLKPVLMSRALRDDVLSLQVQSKLKTFYREMEYGSEKLPEVVSQLRSLSKELVNNSAYAPVRQQIWVAEAAYALHQNKKRAARKFLSLASLEHPEGRILNSAYSTWESPHMVALQEETQKVLSGLRRPCRVSFDVKPAPTRVVVNGFPVTPNGSLRLISGKRFEFEFFRSGFQSVQKVLACKKFGIRKFALRLNPSGNAGEVSVAAVRTEESPKTMLLVEPSDDSYRMLLYTPGVRVDEVPTKSPIRVADNSGTLPIATDVFSSLIEGHRLASLTSSGSAMGELSYAPSSKSKWYNDWKVWVVVGAVVSGVAVAYFATREPSVQTHSGGIKISLD